MKIMEIEGGRELSGTIRVSGAKNATVALIPAAILTDEEATICNIPEITDTDALCDILKELNVDVKRASESIIINPEHMQNIEIKEEYSKKLRASYYFMGALLGKYKKAVMYFPGGCSIGARPIDLHLKGFEALGATVTNEKVARSLALKWGVYSKVVAESDDIDEISAEGVKIAREMMNLKENDLVAVVGGVPEKAHTNFIKIEEI